MRSLILATLLLATPAWAQLDPRGDFRSSQSVVFHPDCPSGWQSWFQVDVWPVGPGGTAAQQLQEAASGSDCEHDNADVTHGALSNPSWDTDVDQGGASDWKVHPAYDIDVSGEIHSLRTHTMLHNTPLQGHPRWPWVFSGIYAGRNISHVNLWAFVPKAFTAVPGVTYTTWFSEVYDADSRFAWVRVACPGQPTIVWNDWTGGALPTFTVPAPTTCRMELQTLCTQQASTEEQHMSCGFATGIDFQ